MKPKTLYILNEGSFEKIYGPDEQAAIAEMCDVYAPVQTRQSIAENPAILKDVEFIFSGWGGPLFDKSFLDNAPTYLVFLTTAGSVGFTEGVTTTVGIVAPKILMAVSAGAVFMGANTYIGNAPNFMVKSIAEENGIKMPSFFGYMVWSLAILIPTFLIDTVIFFLR